VSSAGWYVIPRDLGVLMVVLQAYCSISAGSSVIGNVSAGCC